MNEELLNEVIERLKKEYALAINKAYVYKPLSYAVYQTHKWIDQREKVRRIGEGSGDNDTDRTE